MNELYSEKSSVLEGKILMSYVTPYDEKIKTGSPAA